MTDSSPPRPPESPAVSTSPFRPPRWLPWIVAVALAVGCAWLGQLYLVTRAQNALLSDQQTLADFERRTVQNQLEAERIIARHELAGLRGESANASKSRSSLLPMTRPRARGAPSRGIPPPNKASCKSRTSGPLPPDNATGSGSPTPGTHRPSTAASSFSEPPTERPA